MKADAGESERKRAVILVVEDDSALRSGLAMNLRLEGYEVLLAEDGEAGMRMAFNAAPDLIVLDIMLPCWSGLDILKELRKRKVRVPVLILSARNSMDDKVHGLHIGADDYMTKPFDLPELLARIQVMLRRRQIEQEELPILTVGSMRMNRLARTVQVDGREIELSAKEFDLLRLLAESPGRVFSRDVILEQIWGWDYEGTSRTVDNFVLSLRRKLSKKGGKGVRIRTVPRIGYKLQQI